MKKIMRQRPRTRTRIIDAQRGQGEEIAKAWLLALDADLTQYSEDESGELPGAMLES